MSNPPTVGEGPALTPDEAKALRHGDTLILAGGRHMTRGGQTSYPSREVIVDRVTDTHIKFTDGSGWALANGLAPLSRAMIAATQQPAGEGEPSVVGALRDAIERDLYPTLLEQAGTYIETLYARHKVPPMDRALSPDKYRQFATDLRSALAALSATQQPVSEGVKERFVTGPVWLEPDLTDEDGGPIWTSEVQAIGGYSVIATVHGEDEAEASRRAEAICRTLNRAPSPIGEEKGAGHG